MVNKTSQYSMVTINEIPKAFMPMCIDNSYSYQSWGRYFIIVTSYILLVTYEQCNIL